MNEADVCSWRLEKESSLTAEKCKLVCFLVYVSYFSYNVIRKLFSLGFIVMKTGVIKEINSQLSNKLQPGPC